MRNFYADYVSHMLRQYYRPGGRSNLGEVGKLNYDCVSGVLSQYSDHEEEVIAGLFSTRDGLSDSVKRVAKDFCLSEGFVWALLGRVSKHIAVERGLVERDDPRAG